MDYKKTNAPTNTVTRNLMELCEDTGNIYETVAIIGKRSNQIAVEMKNDLSKKPDSKYVKRIDENFPGTMISMEFYLDKEYIEKQMEVRI